MIVLMVLMLIVFVYIFSYFMHKKDVQYKHLEDDQKELLKKYNSVVEVVKNKNKEVDYWRKKSNTNYILYMRAKKQLKENNHASKRI